MDPFIILGKFTSQGVDTFKDIVARLEQSKADVERAGGRWIGYWLTMGRYDFIAIVEMPDATAMAKVLLAAGIEGNVETETLHAFSEAEAAAMAASMS
jgi:uncharacterized protein with GYD domain